MITYDTGLESRKRNFELLEERRNFILKKIKSEKAAKDRHRLRSKKAYERILYKYKSSRKKNPKKK